MPSSFGSMSETSSSPIVSIESSLRRYQVHGENTIGPSLKLKSSPSLFGLSSRHASFVIFTRSFASENFTIERVEDHSNLVSSFIESNLLRFDIE